MTVPRNFTMKAAKFMVEKQIIHNPQITRNFQFYLRGKLRVITVTLPALRTLLLWPSLSATLIELIQNQTVSQNTFSRSNSYLGPIFVQMANARRLKLWMALRSILLSSSSKLHRPVEVYMWIASDRWLDRPNITSNTNTYEYMAYVCLHVYTWNLWMYTT